MCVCVYVCVCVCVSVSEAINDQLSKMLNNCNFLQNAFAVDM